MSENTEAVGLVERLREKEEVYRDGSGYVTRKSNHINVEAADAIEALSAALTSERAAHAETKRALDEAMKALEPFADIADLIDSETEGMSETDELELHFHDYLMASWPVSLFRAARRVREGGKKNG